MPGYVTPRDDTPDWERASAAAVYHVADWDELPAWQQETDADIFDTIEQHLTTSH